MSDKKQTNKHTHNTTKWESRDADIVVVIIKLVNREIF